MLTIKNKINNFLISDIKINDIKIIYIYLIFFKYLMNNEY